MLLRLAAEQNEREHRRAGLFPDLFAEGETIGALQRRFADHDRGQRAARRELELGGLRGGDGDDLETLARQRGFDQRSTSLIRIDEQDARRLPAGHRAVPDWPPSNGSGAAGFMGGGSSCGSGDRNPSGKWTKAQLTRP